MSKDFQNQGSSLEKNYSPEAVELRWGIDFFKETGIHTANSETVTKGDRESFTVLMPPPNVTGSLTIGHVLNHTIQDIFIRYHRMMGKESLWLPGTDHAGIATQTVVEKQLRKEKLTRYDLGREKFIEKVWAWREEYGNLILKQLAKLGDSADWRRNLFTMDDRANRAVQNAFIRLYQDGLIYKGKRIINWCPVSQTALSDEEVEMRTQRDPLAFVRYFIDDSQDGAFIPVATVRPETMLGDVAVAVNPNDERYQKFLGKFVIEPITKRRIPIIADDYVEIDFGTGALKITPAHDPNDYQVGLRHQLPVIIAIDKHAKVVNGFEPYSGLDRFEARKKILADLEQAGYLIKVEDYEHNVGYSERAGVVVEPFLSEQWFVTMKPLSNPALAAVETGIVKFYPERWKNTYKYWMENVQDWCISRQLWWGHRIPAFYSPDGSLAVAGTKEEAFHQLKAKQPNLTIEQVRQEDDVLDTWFSSWLWPLTTLGWEKPGDDNDDFKAFYPTSTLVTAPDIIFFWVARMIIAGLYFRATEEERKAYFLTENAHHRNENDENFQSFLRRCIPFENVYFTSIIRDQQGRKLSKSIGNSPDPLMVMEKYGTDALRFTVMYLAPLGQDVRIEVNLQTKDMPQVEQGRNFCTKIWNAARFLQMNKAEIYNPLEAFEMEYKALTLENVVPENLPERWIFSTLNSMLKSYHLSVEQLRVNELVKSLYDFIWRDYCDWYLEMLKVNLYSAKDEAEKKRAISKAMFVFDALLRALHPVMPFISEEIWQGLVKREKDEYLNQAVVFHANPNLIEPETEEEMEFLKAIVSNIRSTRAVLGVPPSLEANVLINTHDEKGLKRLTHIGPLIMKLAKVSLEIGNSLLKPKASASSVVMGCDIHIKLEGILDFEKEKARLEKEIHKTEGYIRQIETKLSNAGFVERAPKEIIETEQKKLSDAKETMIKLQENLASLA
ncbi:MAG: valine--tRNA ligase [Chloroherpetonaceae bacterium]|nr:valine--tRNA ligase [Chloroherpetonaceae bacterium]